MTNESTMSTQKFWEDRANEIDAPNHADATSKRNYVLQVMAGTSTSDPRYAELEAHEEALFLEIWTAEVAAARRADWNDWVKSHGKKKIADSAVQAQQTRQGWEIKDLKRAIALHQ